MRALLDGEGGEQQALLCLVDGFKYQYKVMMMLLLLLLLLVVVVLVGAHSVNVFFAALSCPRVLLRSPH